MPSVTQRVDNYLGGVSRQSDDKKLPGQVKECLNGYPDPTFGLTKRPGFKWIANLGTGTTYDNSKWFYIARSDTEKYIGCITPATYNNATPPVLQANGGVFIWNAVTGVQATVVYGTGAQAYLTATNRKDYDVLTVQDTTIITNKTTTITTRTPPPFVAKAQATIKLVGDVTATPYKINVNNTGDINHTGGTNDKYEDILTHFETQINGKNISGLTITKTADSLYLSRVVSGTATAFTITGIGGKIGNKLQIFQDQVSAISELPNESKHNHVVKILSSGAGSAAYYMKYTADNGTSGAGFWSETIGPGVSVGLENTTMPHELVNPSLNNFTFKTISYTERDVGDDETNSHPSFVQQKIQQAFFHNNRLGFISTDNVSLSQSAEFFEFYHTSAQLVTDSDPIDIRAATTRPAALHSVLPTTQGLVLFSADQQFLMSAANGILTPSTTTVRAISNYETDIEVRPVDTGTTLNFISKTPSYTRIFAMITRGENENPTVLDIGRIVNEWVPASVDTMISSPQNQFIAFSGQSTRYIYFFRTYNDGERNVVQAWFNWLAPGNVQTVAADSDEFYSVTKQNNQFTLLKASLSQSPDDAIIVNNDDQRINPCIDLYTEANNGLTGASQKKVIFDSTNDLSKCYIPYTNVTGLTPVLIIKGDTRTGNFIESGFTITPETGSDTHGTFFKVPGKDLTSVEDDVIVGYKYDFDVILPKTYFKMDEAGSKSDFTANVTIARMKFAVGLSGVMGFKVKMKGRRQGKKEYVADGTTKVFQWDPSDLDYVDDDQIKVKINNIVTTDYTVDTTATPLPKITLTDASSESKTLSGDGTTKVFDLTFVPKNIPKMKVKIGVNNFATASPVGSFTTQTVTTDYIINGQFIHFTAAPASGTNNILVYSEDDIIIYLDEWYNLNPVISANEYLANDIALAASSVFTLPLHQKSANFDLRLFNDTPFPVSLNSMMWEGIYSPRFYRRT